MTSITTYKEITPTYLCIKQHSVTKLKYFCKTTRLDPIKYKGSGVRWTEHINKHGRQFVETIWLSDLYYDTSIREPALHFSCENNIDTSPLVWANLIPEDGLTGGDMGPDGRRKISDALTGRPRTPESIEKQKKTLADNPVEITQERCDNISKSLTGTTWTEERHKKAKLNPRITSEETKLKQKNSSARAGTIPWNYGLKEPDHITKKRSEKLKGKGNYIYFDGTPLRVSKDHIDVKNGLLRSVTQKQKEYKNSCNNIIITFSNNPLVLSGNYILLTRKELYHMRKLNSKFLTSDNKILDEL